MLVKFSDIERVAQDILDKLLPGNILALFGPLAAGKTTLTQAILKQMGYSHRVTSPTFVLEKHYPLTYKNFQKVVHLDFYRLKPDELTSFGWKEYLGDETALTIIEWPEIGLENLPKDIKTIKIKIIDDQTRDFLFSKNFGF